MVMGLFSARNGEWVKNRQQAETLTEQEIRIVEPVIWAIGADSSGDTMRRFCGLVGSEFLAEKRTRQGAASVRCRAGSDRVEIAVEGRRYATENPVVRAEFSLSSDGGVWKAS